eukprot:5370138-Alexandrium_andersonii.AAC.1
MVHSDVSCSAHCDAAIASRRPCRPTGGSCLQIAAPWLSCATPPPSRRRFQRIQPREQQWMQNWTPSRHPSGCTLGLAWRFSTEKAETCFGQTP